MIRPSILVLSLCAIGCSVIESKAPAPSEIAGTYRVSFCEGDCATDPNKIQATVVLDKTRKAFSHETDAMKFLMRADSGLMIPNYCYFFDPSVSTGSLLEQDTVGFGELGRAQSGADEIYFLLDSPDFRFISAIKFASPDSFVGDWTQAYAPDEPEKIEAFKVHGRRASDADATVCFDAVRTYERSALKGYCNEFPADTCEPGDKVGHDTRQ